MRDLIDLTGRKFGYWTVLQRVPADVIARERPGHGGEAMWYCKCKCGEVHMVYGAALRYGRSHGCQSCSAKGRHNGGNPWKAEEAARIAGERASGELGGDETACDMPDERE